MVDSLLNTEPSVELRYVSTTNQEEHTVPSSRLVESITGIEKIFELISTLYDDELATDKTNRRTKKSVRVLVSTPSSGSICIPLAIMPSSKELFSERSGQQLTSIFWRILSAI